jgi:hypothetical protein
MGIIKKVHGNLIYGTFQCDNRSMISVVTTVKKNIKAKQRGHLENV